MQRLKMLNKGPNGSYRRGQVIEVDDLRAVLLIDGGHAVPEGEEVRDDSDTVDTEELQALSGPMGFVGDL